MRWQLGRACHWVRVPVFCISVLVCLFTCGACIETTEYGVRTLKYILTIAKRLQYHTVPSLGSCPRRSLIATGVCFFQGSFELAGTTTFIARYFIIPHQSQTEKVCWAL